MWPHHRSVPAALVLASFLGVAGGCDRSGGTGKEPNSPPKRAVDIELDGFAIGTKLDTLMKRAPYDKPCDMDVLSEANRSVVVFPGQPCRDSEFPDDTTLLLLLALGEGDEEQQTRQPIEAIAWMGGTYFDDRSNLPVKIGATKTAVDAALGPASASFPIGSDHERVTDRPPEPIGDPLLAHGHGGDIWSLTRSDVAVGFIVGVMPTSGEDAQWKMTSQIFFEHAVKK